ncbi:MAG: hypothetical protein HYY78_00325 [Betaproteobacteria bacterium]|nr:hypothetical protein [Betaproteobacteria bacterium]
MARTVRDAALLPEVLSGHDPEDPGSTVPERRKYAVDLDRGIRGLRVGFVRHFHESDSSRRLLPDRSSALACRGLYFSALRVGPRLLPIGKIPP